MGIFPQCWNTRPSWHIVCSAQLLLAVASIWLMNPAINLHFRTPNNRPMCATEEVSCEFVHYIPLYVPYPLPHPIHWMYVVVFRFTFLPSCMLLVIYPNAPDRSANESNRCQMAPESHSLVRLLSSTGMWPQGNFT